MPVSRICALVSCSTSAGRGAVNRILLVEFDLAPAVDRVARDVKDAAQHARADRHRDRRAGVDDGHAALQPLRRGHRDRPGEPGAEMLLHLEGQQFLLAADLEVDRERLVDGRDGVLGELDVDDRADDLDDFSGIHGKIF